MELSTNSQRRILPAFLAAWLALAFPMAARAQFKFSTNNAAITITGYSGAGGHVEIPSTITGYPVTAIENNAFSYKADLTGVTIPDSVTSINSFAFAYSGLASVTIPAGVVTLDNAFMCCPSLTNISVNIANPYWRGEGGVLFNKTLSVLAQCPGGLNGLYAIPNGVTNIGAGAFYYCPGLTSVTIPNTVTSIGSSAFAYSGLTSITVPRGVIGWRAFAGCHNLRSVVLGNGVVSIEGASFSDCYSLENITLGNSLASIGGATFEFCSGLASVTIPSSVTNISGGAFQFCDGLNQVYFQGNAPRLDGEAGSGNINVFYGEMGTVFYRPGTAGWGSKFGNWPTASWYQPQPQILGNGSGLVVNDNQFNFTISWATNTLIVVEASTNLRDWKPVATNTLAGGTNSFSDLARADYPNRYYRVRTP